MDVQVRLEGSVMVKLNPPSGLQQLGSELHAEIINEAVKLGVEEQIGGFQVESLRKEGGDYVAVFDFPELFGCMRKLMASHEDLERQLKEYQGIPAVVAHEDSNEMPVLANGITLPEAESLPNPNPVAASNGVSNPSPNPEPDVNPAPNHVMPTSAHTNHHDDDGDDEFSPEAAGYTQLQADLEDDDQDGSGDNTQN